MRRALKIGALVLGLVLLGLSPYLSGLVARRRLVAVVSALDAAAGDRVSIRLTALSAGYLSSEGTVEITIDAFAHEERFEVPFRVGHGPIPFPDIFAGRSAFRVCAGFVSVDSGRGRGPTGNSLAPLRGRLVLGFFGGVESELGMEAADLKPLTPLGAASAARITLTGDEDRFTLEAYLGEWQDLRSDAPSLEIGGALAVLRFEKERIERSIEIARIAYQDGATVRTIEQLQISQRSERSGESRFSARASMIRLELEDGVESLESPAFSYAARRAGAIEQGTIALSFDAYSGPLGTYKDASLRGTTRVSPSALGPFVSAIGHALRPTPSGAPSPREPFEPATLAVALFADLDDPRVTEVEGAYRAVLRTRPTATFDVELADGDRTKLLAGRMGLSVDASAVRDSDSVRVATQSALVLDLDLGMSRALGLALARLEVERRARDLTTADDAERRDTLVREVFDAALDARVLTARDDLFHLRASIPLGEPERARFGDRTLASFAGAPLGLALRRAEMPRVRIALGAVVSSGEITDGQVIVALAPRARALRLCGEGELLDAPPVLEGDVQIAFEVAPTGAVTSTSVLVNTLNDESVAACLAQVLTQLPMPATRRGGRSVVPIHITRGGAPPAPEAPQEPPPEPPQAPPPVPAPQEGVPEAPLTP